jgi:hypothetical protein
MSALKALLAAMPDIARALAGFDDPQLKLRAFDALVHAALTDNGNNSGGSVTYPPRGHGDTAILPRIT